MFKTLTVYETSDRRRFDCVDKASEHVADAARAILDARLEELQRTGRLSANDRYRIIMAIIPDADAAASLHQALARWIDY